MEKRVGMFRCSECGGVASWALFPAHGKPLYACSRHAGGLHMLARWKVCLPTLPLCSCGQVAAYRHDDGYACYRHVRLEGIQGALAPFVVASDDGKAVLMVGDDRLDVGPAEVEALRAAGCPTWAHMPPEVVEGVRHVA